MNIILLADGPVGLRVAQYLRNIDPPVGLVVHPPRSSRLGDEIVRAAGVVEQDVLATDKLHTPDSISRLREWNPDILVSAWYGYILKPEVLAIPHRGCVNLHPAYLPYNRGKFPNVWSILEGTPAGATIHYMDEGIDTGDVIMRKRVDVDASDTGASLYEKLEAATVEVFQEAWPLLREGTAPRVPQADLPGHPTFHLARDVERIDAISLDATYSAEELLNLLRARTFAPHPAAYFEADGRRIYVRVELSED
jgi:methionyl-tRNA formyltransferase